MKTITIGYPRVGPMREMKKALEEYWGKKCDLTHLMKTSSDVFEKSVREQLEANVSVIGVGHHTMYDHILDWVVRFGLIPRRFETMKSNRTDLYFAMARGVDDKVALDMTKWFDTNYHNLTPEVEGVDALKKLTPDFEDYLDMIRRAIKIAGNDGKRIGAEMIGPITFAHKAVLKSGVTSDQVVEHLLPLYETLLKELKKLGVAEAQVNEPLLVTDESGKLEGLYSKVMSRLCGVGVPINLVTYYDDLTASYAWVTKLPVASISMDFTRGENLSLLKQYGFPENKRLGMGIVDGRSVWKDVTVASDIYKNIRDVLGENADLSVQPSSSLQHLPLDVRLEEKLEAALKEKLSFTLQKLEDMQLVASSAPGAAKGGVAKIGAEEDVAEPAKDKITREAPFEKRRALQVKMLNGLRYPTSTIGSFPQTDDMRKIRLQYRKGQVSEAAYHQAVDAYISYCIGVQEGVGLDVLVHGEPERSDMVEFFAEQMDGFAFTQHGWVQSYGSRYVRPPIVCGDVSRKAGKPMTLREYLVAQNCTKKPVKGMLTGPTTILNWSFPRKDLSRKAQAFQIAAALRDEIDDLQKNGCRVVQVDEPALREGLPIRGSRAGGYLDWAVKSFRLTTSVAASDCHVVTHFCYSEFEDVMEAIKNLDADQITIENSRSDNQVLKFLVEKKYDHDVAPGVYDVHSPVVPPVKSLVDRMKMIQESGLQNERVWVVPDCGLKTRKWCEVIPALRNLVSATEEMRQAVIKSA